MGPECVRACVRSPDKRMTRSSRSPWCTVCSAWRYFRFGRFVCSLCAARPAGRPVVRFNGSRYRFLTLLARTLFVVMWNRLLLSLLPLLLPLFCVGEGPQFALDLRSFSVTPLDDVVGGGGGGSLHLLPAARCCLLFGMTT